VGIMPLCEYGCGQEAIHQFKNEKWCCGKSKNSCPAQKKIISEKNKGKKRSVETIKKLKEARKYISDETRTKMSESHKGKKQSYSVKRKISVTLRKAYLEGKRKYVPPSKKPIFNKNHIKLLKQRCEQQLKFSNKLTISKIKRKYPFFAQVEEMRYNPDKPTEKEIQVHCKNHNCKNSKEHDGWFTPTYQQIKTRRDWLENEGKDICYFYCSERCKEECPLYQSNGNDPFKVIRQYYTKNEYQQFREYVLERDKNKCQYCGEKADHVHHERPQKLEPFYALDPDYAWSCCLSCHYEKGHKDECSTGNLANTMCI
jgi:hypothetical protein